MIFQKSARPSALYSRAMHCSDLRGGDILLQASTGSAAGEIISFGQQIRGQSHFLLVHAGILFDNHYLVQALWQGITATDLRIQDVRNGYLVFRCTNPNLAAGAATCAKMMLDIHATHGTLKYSIVGAVGSLFGSSSVKTGSQMDGLLDNILTGRGHPFFCSQFVVYVYQYVAEQNGMRASALFNLGDPKVSPGLLADTLERSTFFKIVGSLAPGER